MSSTQPTFEDLPRTQRGHAAGASSRAASTSFGRGLSLGGGEPEVPVHLTRQRQAHDTYDGDGVPASSGLLHGTSGSHAAAHPEQDSRFVTSYQSQCDGTGTQQRRTGKKCFNSAASSATNPLATGRGIGASAGSRAVLGPQRTQQLGDATDLQLGTARAVPPAQATWLGVGIT
jgi:hypothetical protein